MAKVSMLARLVVHDGKGDELIAAFEDVFRQVEDRSSSDPNLFWFYELYTDGNALGSHGGSDAMKKAGAVFGPLIAESELVLGSPVRAKGVAV